MQVNLTHEQADFDGIACLLGAKLLNEGSISVFPRKANKNVRDFYHLYAASFPFILSKDIPKQSIELITLVDTQSLITIKGFNKHTRIKKIDHHANKSSLEKDDFTFVKYGACTTYFVEQLRNSHKSLTPIEATLLLLGIYEDTGMLTYTNTTPEDAAAVSYLLSAGANLEIASKFLNPPLSNEQHAVFQTLMENAISISIEGLAVLVTYCSAPKLEDEISSIAHKINDLLDPDALFVFVQLKEGIRLVARSSTNQIDTAIIAKKYDGGGHRRASAALIRVDSGDSDLLEGLVDDFVTSLHTFVHPAMKVSKLMSTKPLTLTPSTTLPQARKLMEQFGYEGFPVIEEGKIVGLLKRRAVDKAVTHNLKKDVSSLLEAGNFSVTPDDPISHLQRVMADSGWGQIPVVDTKTRKIIGIATRTDLLKILTAKDEPKNVLNLTDAIHQQIPSGQFEFLKIISQETAELNIPLFIVGGFVRDIVLRKNSPDLDFVVEGDAIELAMKLADAYGGKITSHKKFGTAKWWPRYTEDSDDDKGFPMANEFLSDIPDTIDFISARTEFYEKPTALPTIKKGSIKLDLHRRDFTINTMAVRLDGHYFGDVYDHWGGLNDITNKKIRVLHSLSFVDDPTRILRAVRFEQRFDFQIEERTLELLREAIPMLDEVSGDRIRHELDQIFAEEDVCKPMNRLSELGVLSQIYQAIHWDQEVEKNFKLSSPILEKLVDAGYINISGQDTLIQIYYLILFCRLAPFDMKDVIKRLRFKSAFQKILLGANHLWHTQESLVRLSAGQFTEEIEKHAPLSVSVVRLLSINKKLNSKIDSFIRNWRFIQIETTGEDLKKFNIPPGPIYKSILQNLRIAKINGEISNIKDEQKALKEILSKI